MSHDELSPDEICTYLRIGKSRDMYYYPWRGLQGYELEF
jgi:hypothetical protein